MVDAASTLEKIEKLIAQARADLQKTTEVQTELLIRIARLEVQRDIAQIGATFSLSDPRS